jgi:hypothetical protein
MGQWFCVLDWMPERQSAQIRWVQGRILGGRVEDQQTMQSGSSGGEVGEASLLDGVGGGGGGAVAVGRLLRNLSKLGKLAAAGSSDGLSGRRLQVMAKAVKTKARDQ